MVKRIYNWRPDVPDARDLYYRDVKSFRLLLPRKVDLRPKMSKVEDQGNLGSCTGQAFAGNLEYLARKDVTSASFEASRLFIYYNERRLDGTTRTDSGAYIRDGIKALAKWGVCEEKLWPYDIQRFAVKPSRTAYTMALSRKITSYLRVKSLRELRQCLAEGFPVVFGFAVYESFESQATTITGVMRMPRDDEEMLGGHAVLAVGYDDRKKHVICRNSWGESWGSDGHFFMPYDYVSDPDLADDFWSVRQ